MEKQNLSYRNCNAYIIAVAYLEHLAENPSAVRKSYYGYIIIPSNNKQQARLGCKKELKVPITLQDLPQQDYVELENVVSWLLNNNDSSENIIRAKNMCANLSETFQNKYPFLQFSIN